MQRAESLWQGEQRQRDFLSWFKLFHSFKPTLVYQDNKSAIHLSQGGTNHKRSKHFSLEFFALKEFVKRGEMVLQYVPTGDLAADLLTKPLGAEKFARFRDEVVGTMPKTRFFSSNNKDNARTVRSK